MTDQLSSAAQPLCDGHALKQLMQAGTDWLGKHHTIVNQLNVFPVPDGDTGINMLMTMRNALKEVDHHENDHIGQVAAEIANGAMMGSRGNSGTILSQLWQGFAHALRDHPTLDAEGLVIGLREATDTAYRGVIKPVEGTILTVAREAAEEAEAAYQDTQDPLEIFERALARAQDALERTPDMLPILKQAGVVDSGGSGLVYILEGMLRHIRGETVEADYAETEPVEDLATTLAPEDELGYGYDVQFILKSPGLDVNAVRAAIDSMGWSTVVVGNERAIKVHVHVHDPGIPLSYGVSLGDISDIVVENMQEQYHDYVREHTEQTNQVTGLPVVHTPNLSEDDIGVVTVASGEGLAQVFRQLGAAELIMGGQTNNPSTQEILEAVQRVPTQKIILLPNNKNIFMAAEQAAKLAADQEVVVIPTRSMPQGISALLSYNPQGDLESLVAAMYQAKDDVTTGEVTTATRSVKLNGVDVDKGQLIGLVDGALYTAGNDLKPVLQTVLHHMCSADYELITLYYGHAIQEADAQQLIEELSQLYTEHDFELVYGGQAHYHYILSAE